MQVDKQTSPVLACEHLNMVYEDGDLSVEVLRDINFRIAQAERIAIVGASGSGKSTLLHLLGGLERPSAGDVFIGEQLFSAMSDAKRGLVRNRSLGFIYQFHHLLPEFTALENVAMPLLIGKKNPDDAFEEAKKMLSDIGLEHRLEHRPAELSGGERQRAAIARALVTRPDCVLADEPTGNLDEKTATTVFSRMLELNRDFATALVMVTHDTKLASRMDRVYQLSEGRLRQISSD